MWCQDDFVPLFKIIIIVDCYPCYVSVEVRWVFYDDWLFFCDEANNIVHNLKPRK